MPSLLQGAAEATRVRSMQGRHLLQGLPGAHSTQNTGRPCNKGCHQLVKRPNKHDVGDVHMCTCACSPAHKHTHRHTRKCLTVALPPQPAPFPSVTARSRRGRPGTRASASPLLLFLTPARQRSRRLTRCAVPSGKDCQVRGVPAQERAAREVAAAVQTWTLLRHCCVGLQHPR